MTVITARRTGGGKKVRDRQRLAHLVAGIAVVAYVYAPGAPALEAAVRWVILPLLAASGVLMWQWPKVRRLARKLRTRA
ncbi:hypothetical protein [Kribbella sp. NPDC050470]|uniref:hypothetical protein n=1 Tax=unclassified Kribbella TaxID=2644121 RepID=UPI00378B3429